MDRSPTALLLAVVLLVSGCSDYAEVRWGDGTSWAEAKQRARNEARREAAAREAAARETASARERAAQAQAAPGPVSQSGGVARPEPTAGAEPAAGGAGLGAWLDGMFAWLFGAGADGAVGSDTLVGDAEERERIRAAASSEPPPLSGSGFLWPARGQVIAGFGELPDGTRNDGINIAARERSDVVAAENGVVAYAGDEIAGYGQLILIRHADGFTTAYAHNEAVLVRVGEVVRRGQPIARVGRTGGVATAQLHFEIRQGETPLDPSSLLSGGGRPVAELGTPSG